MYSFVFWLESLVSCWLQIWLGVSMVDGDDAAHLAYIWICNP